MILSLKDKFKAEYYETPSSYLTLMDKVKRDQHNDCEDSGQGNDEKEIANRFKPVFSDLIPGFDREEGEEAR